MIVVLGPGWLADAVGSADIGELVVGAGEDSRLASDATRSAELAAVLPLPARACVVSVPDGLGASEVVDAVREAGGALSGARIVVVGPPPPNIAEPVWSEAIRRLGAEPVPDVDGLAVALARDPAVLRPSPRERRAMRPGAPEAAAWRDALRSARPRRRFLRRRHAVEGRAAERELDALIRQPLPSGCHFVAVISPKGGVGKTFLAFLLGSILAAVRQDRVLVVDTNPDFGTLADLVSERVPATIGDVLDDLDHIESDADIAAYATTTGTGMQILAAPQDPTEMTRLGREGYAAVSDLLAAHYDIVIFDCGTGFLDEITQFALRRAGQVVLVSAPQLVTSKIVMGAANALAAMDFDLSRATLALNMLRGDEPLDRHRLRSALVGRAAGVVEVPHDEKLRLALDLGEFDHAQLAPATRQALKRLAAEVVMRIPAAASGDGPPQTGAMQNGSAAEEPGEPPVTAETRPDSGPARAAARTLASLA